jgi:hypothetical protein
MTKKELNTLVRSLAHWETVSIQERDGVLTIRASQRRG